MFSQSKSKGVQPKGTETQGTVNIIGQGTVIEGQIRSSGDLRIDGTIMGSVTSKSKVVLGITGQVIGDVICQNADISGSIKGKTTVVELLFLKSTAKINGDIITGKLVVEVGASFTGNCNMGPMIKDMNHAGKQPEVLLSEKSA